ncbi:MAG: hypothetical protein ABI333_14995 [bacterium]
MAKQSNQQRSNGKLSIPGLAITAVAALTMAAAVLVPADADACKRHYYRRDPRPSKAKVDGRWEVKLGYYNKYYSFRGGNYRLQNIHVYTKDSKLAEFVHKQGATRSFWNALRGTVQRYSCADLLVGKRLVKLERGIAAGIARYYFAKSKRRAQKLDVMLSLSQYYSSYCNPPKQPPRAKRIP